MRKSWRLLGVALPLLLAAEAAARSERWAGISSADHFGGGACPMVAFTLYVDGVVIDGTAESDAGRGKVKWTTYGTRTHDFIQIEMSYRPWYSLSRIRVQWTGFQRHGLMQLTSSRGESCRQPRSVNLRRID
jgi:hypothetical protein